MGCDIHTHVEIKKTVNEREGWHCADFFSLNSYFGIWEDEKQYDVVGLCGDRNYSLFAVLADVRNYGETEFICEPKGIPEDACKQTREDYGEWSGDAHSASHFTLRELMDWQNTAPPLKHSGMITRESSDALDKGVLPSCWCQWTNQPDCVKREWEEPNDVLVPLIEALKQRGKDLYFWYTDEQIEENAEKMRFVFWFDN